MVLNYFSVTNSLRNRRRRSHLDIFSQFAILDPGLFRQTTKCIIIGCISLMELIAVCGIFYWKNYCLSLRLCNFPQGLLFGI